MNKFQKVSFKSVDDFLDYIPAEELKIVELLRQIINNCIPDCKEKLSNNVPFFSRHKNICYIWPSSIPWGAVDKGVAIGFTQGSKLSIDEGYFEKNTTTKVYKKIFTDIKQIDIELLKSLLYEAVIIDQNNAKTRREKNNYR
jgi:uncharacterized protein YdhG (YjbR/CyaY superfamily)